MDIITSHVNTDFDGFASMVAARRLYPGAEIVLSGQLQPNVRNYIALYRDVWLPVTFSELPQERIERLIVVDTARPERLGVLRPIIEQVREIHLYDHHPPALDDLKAAHRMVEPLGAATTILVELLQKKNLPINYLEATLFCLGIYDDTGSLLYSSTTPQDVEAVAWLLKCGADLSIVSNYMGYLMSTEQRSLLRMLLQSGQIKELKGLNIFHAQADLPQYIRGLDMMAQRLMEIVSADAVFLSVKMSERIYLVARSRTDVLQLHKLMKLWGGGGHLKAASAVVRQGTLEEVAIKLKNYLEQVVEAGSLARSIMSSPVKTISQGMSLQEAGAIMLRYGHSGLPVIDGPEGKLLGIISRRDVDKARQHNLSHAPVKGFMSRKVITAEPETSIQKLQELMVENDIGRLPVLENGKLIGIVSRSDVLRKIYTGRYFHNFKSLCNLDTGQVIRSASWDLSGILKKRLPDFIWLILQEIGECAEQLTIPLYLAGEFIRDILLNRPNKELDLLAVGEKKLFLALEKRWEGFLSEDDAFFSLPDGYRLHVKLAKREFREFPVEESEASSVIRHELYNRDFTVNTLAVSLNKKTFGYLLDVFDGQNDILKKQLRVLHNFSFVENPLRMLRIVCLAQNTGLSMEKQTKLLLEDAVRESILQRVDKEVLAEETVKCFKEDKSKELWQRLKEIGLADQLPALLGEERFNKILHSAVVQERKD